MRLVLVRWRGHLCGLGIRDSYYTTRKISKNRHYARTQDNPHLDDTLNEIRYLFQNVDRKPGKWPLSTITKISPEKFICVWVEMTADRFQIISKRNCITVGCLMRIFVHLNHSNLILSFFGLFIV